jgi:hypothetical protein
MTRRVTPLYYQFLEERQRREKEKAAAAKRRAERIRQRRSR